jgi:hypothetical protein
MAYNLSSEDGNIKQASVVRHHYHIQNGEDYHNLIIFLTTCTIPFLRKDGHPAVIKLYDVGTLNATSKLSVVDNKLAVAAFRLP